jgi:hypothetical protein
MLGFLEMLPPILRRGAWPILTLPMTMLLLVAPLDFIRQGGPIVWVASAAVWLIGMTILLPIQFRWKVDADDLVRRVKTLGTCPCGHCGHDLAGLEELGACPQCGAKVNLPKLRNFWNRCVNYRALGPAGLPPKHPMVPWLLRLRTRFQWWFIGGALAIIGFMFIPLLVGSTHFSFFYFVAPFIVSFTIPAIVAAQIGQRICRRITQRNGLVCLKCGGDLVVDGADAECAACHLRCQASEAKAAWDQWKPPCWNVEAMDA